MSGSAISATSAFPRLWHIETQNRVPTLYLSQKPKYLQYTESSFSSVPGPSIVLAMAYLTYRLLTTTSFRRASAAEACTEIFERFGQGERPISIRRTLLDANQLHLLSTTLGRNSSSYQAPKQGTPIPPGYHLVYFTPSFPERELGRDGTDRTVSPLSPYTRRMWAGGELEWSQDASNLLKVGQTVTETTRILSADPKKLKNGGEMIVVGVEKTFENEQGLALTDRRNWVFQKEIGYGSPLKVLPTPKEKELPEGSCLPLSMLKRDIFRQGYLGFELIRCRNTPKRFQPITSNTLPFLSIDIQRPQDPLFSRMVSRS